MMIESINKELITNLKSNIKNNLISIILFGSGNTDEFIKGVSDLDYFIILRRINFKNLQDINKQRLYLMKKYDIKIDFKIISKQELDLSLKGTSSFEFFNGWGLKAIQLKREKVIFGKENIRSVFQNNISLKRFSLERMSYYLHKLRKIMVLEEHLFHNQIKKLSNNEKLKIISSSIKNTLAFYLANKGIFVYSNKELISEIKDSVMQGMLLELFEMKKANKYDEKYLQKCYDQLEVFLEENLE